MGNDCTTCTQHCQKQEQQNDIVPFPTMKLQVLEDQDAPPMKPHEFDTFNLKQNHLNTTQNKESINRTEIQSNRKELIIGKSNRELLPPESKAKIYKMALNSAKEKLIDDPNFKPTNLPNQKLTNSILENMETNKKQPEPEPKIDITQVEQKQKTLQKTNTLPNKQNQSKNQPVIDFHIYFSETDRKETANLFISNFNQNTKEQRLPFTYSSGSTYTGEWIGNMRDGRGIQLFPDGSVYNGEFKQNRVTGLGSFTNPNLFKYIGYWEDDLPAGYGEYVSPNYKYEGEWLKGLQNGKGSEIFEDGEYSGDFVDGQREGIGTYNFKKTGSVYNGQWRENSMDGMGIYEWKDGRVYTGMWKENYMNGQGEYKWKDGRRYKGEYESDQKHGIGTYFFGDGRYYSGHWEHGKQHGEGIYFDEGVIRKGIWKEGERVMWTEE